MFDEKRKLVEPGYDCVAGDYHRQRELHSEQALLEQFAALLPPAGQVLDIGCGAGVPIAKFFSDRGYAVVGIDLSQAMLDLAKANVPDGRFLKGDMSELNFPDASCQVVACCRALVHLPREEHERVLSGMERVLSPGGALLLVTGHKAWEGVEEFLGVQMYWSHFGPEWYLARVEQLGLTVKFCEIIEHDGERHNWLMAVK